MAYVMKLTTLVNSQKTSNNLFHMNKLFANLIVNFYRLLSRPGVLNLLVLAYLQIMLNPPPPPHTPKYKFYTNCTPERRNGKL